MNIQDKSDDIAESNKDLEDENDEEIKFNLDDISRELQHEPAVKVCHVLDFVFIFCISQSYFFLVGGR